jgi:CheY-like chemotaxis protein/two-component sensor histidine kinase
MRRQLQQMVRLVDDLLDISRIQKGAISLRFDTVEVRRFLEASIETTRPQVNASEQKITMALPADPLFVKGDEARLAQVISNILNNASKFAPHGGTIHVVAERKSDQALIRITDSGIGIPAHYLETIFDMFVQVDGASERSRGGLGIGLALVKQIVSLHGGSVKAASRGVGFGSEFIVMLPIAVESREPLPIESRALPRRDRGKERKILIVDDNVDAVQSLALVLRTKGHEVREAFDGQHALVIASEFTPDIAICDIAMPGMDGYELAKRLRAMYPTGLTLIAVTGYGTEEDRARTKESGFDAHFVKPANIEDLQLTIDRAKGGVTN